MYYVQSIAKLALSSCAPRKSNSSSLYNRNDRGTERAIVDEGADLGLCVAWAVD